MTIYRDTLKIKGATLDGINPQPVFRDRKADMYCVEDGSLHPEDHLGFGIGCGARTLPYRMQDRYDRSEKDLELQTLVMENDFLKATFLPEYGGKLWSLYAKDEQRELLFVNPVFRFANLASRNAWMSGGIEWNLGHTGHNMFTSDHVFFAKVNAPDGEEFLRMYEYEAAHAQILQIDFHLPDGARQLAAHVRIQNARDVDVPLYWWTNIAVPLTDDTRVFSGTPDILFQLIPQETGGVPGFGHCHMPSQPNLPGVDLSHPRQIPHSLEYFFQNRKQTVSPWEVSIEKDCRGFMERSTQPLRTRKMFCWGSNTGGRHWCDYLSRDGQGDYIEIQAGLAPTQLHTGILEADQVVSFTQMFGAFTAPESAQNAEWNEALPHVEASVARLLPAASVQKAHAEYLLKSTIPAREVLHTGSWYGAMEMARRRIAGEPPIACHLDFLSPEAESEYTPWFSLLQGEALPESRLPHPYVTDPLWLPYLSRAAENGNQETRFQYAVALAENGNTQTAGSLLTALTREENPWAAHALGMLYRRNRKLPQACQWLMQAYVWEHDSLDCSFAEDALQSLLDTEQYEKAWELYENIPEALKTEAEELLAASAAVKLDKHAFLSAAYGKVYSAIREGAVGLAEIWYEEQARLAAQRSGIPFRDDLIDRTLPLPRNLNFLMFRDDH